MLPPDHHALPQAGPSKPLAPFLLALRCAWLLRGAAETGGKGPSAVRKGSRDTRTRAPATAAVRSPPRSAPRLQLHQRRLQRGAQPPPAAGAFAKLGSWFLFCSRFFGRSSAPRLAAALGAACCSASAWQHRLRRGSKHLALTRPPPCGVAGEKQSSGGEDACLGSNGRHRGDAHGCACSAQRLPVWRDAPWLSCFAARGR